MRHDGVDRVYAMQAGREIRVMVALGAIDDDVIRGSRSGETRAE